MSTPVKLLLLLIAAIVVALSVRSLYLNLAGTNEVLPAESMAQIRVAADDLPAGLLLRNEDLDWREVPKSRVPAGAIVEGSPATDSITGVMVRRDLKAQAPILERDIIRPNAPGFLSAALKPGMRAVSVAVDSVSGNAGLIQPGDYVDMILVQEAGSRGNAGFGFPESQAKSRSVVSETVVEKARVIAVGSEFLQHAQDEAARRDTARTPARTVTLEVQPRAAEAISVASRLGTITLALRSFAVTERPSGQEEQAGTWAGKLDDSGPLWAGDVSQAIAAAAEEQARRTAGTPVTPSAAGSPPVQNASPASARQITIYRGSEQSTQTLGVTNQ